jgi:hypothetical protein
MECFWPDGRYRQRASDLDRWVGEWQEAGRRKTVGDVPTVGMRDSHVQEITQEHVSVWR